MVFCLRAGTAAKGGEIMLEDAAIVELFWKRSEEALRETARKYGGYCRTIIRNLLGDRREDVEECENDTMLSAWNSMPAARPQRRRIVPCQSRTFRTLLWAHFRRRRPLLSTDQR